jgi:hypothetical protein
MDKTATPLLDSPNTLPTEPNPQDKPVTPPNLSDWPKEIGGNGGLEPTRHGDWTTPDGRCTDF